MSKRVENVLADEEGRDPLKTRLTAGSGTWSDLAKSERPGDALTDEGPTMAGNTCRSEANERVRRAQYSGEENKRARVGKQPLGTRER
ncbi:hypothetical protein NDU88_011091 [Pleurodeles waltl]|uniref:Uncharacterized protein n=1 Tax=Pleurodeles waltl TaxID=8319 RepID=A0AAV7Q0L0_PLEWA|nr:hypothetical protein NDU88_011091 [Pleurodeles waltl]